MTYVLSLRLRSDAAFGNGDGIPGLLDLDISYDEAGCPFLGGRALKGLLRDAAEQLRYALADRWSAALHTSSQRLFGSSGAGVSGNALMHVGAATLPPALLAALHAHVADPHDPLTADQVLEALTTLRRQTAVDSVVGAPETGSLRTVRVLLRETLLLAPLQFAESPSPTDLALLAACALAVRAAGTGRNRGRGALQVLLHENEPDDVAAPAATAYTQQAYQRFRTLVLAAAPEVP
jgi:hypothetical protein